MQSKQELPGIFHMHFSNGAANGNRAKCRQTLAASTSKCCPSPPVLRCIALVCDLQQTHTHMHTYIHTQTVCLCVCFRLILARTYMRLVNSSKHGAKLATVSHSRSVMHFCGCQRRRVVGAGVGMGALQDSHCQPFLCSSKM